MNYIITMWKLFRCSPDFTRARRSWSTVRVTQMCDWCAKMIQDVLALKVHMPRFCGASKRKKPWRLVFCKIFGYTWTDTRCNLFFCINPYFHVFFLQFQPSSSFVNHPAKTFIPAILTLHHKLSWKCNQANTMPGWTIQLVNGVNGRQSGLNLSQPRCFRWCLRPHGPNPRCALVVDGLSARVDGIPTHGNPGGVGMIQ